MLYYKNSKFYIILFHDRGRGGAREQVTLRTEHLADTPFDVLHQETVPDWKCMENIQVQGHTRTHAHASASHTHARTRLCITHFHLCQRD